MEYSLYKKIANYIFSGGMGAVTNLGLLYILTEFADIYYVLSGIISFVISIFVSFSLQKRLTFKDDSSEGTHKKFITFAIIAIVNLCINTLLLYLLVEMAGAHYMLAQFISSGLIALWSYFAYKKLVFKESVVNKICKEI